MKNTSLEAPEKTTKKLIAHAGTTDIYSNIGAIGNYEKYTIM